MDALETVKRFFHACESGLGWERCRAYVAGDASFHSPATSYQGITTMQAYCEQVAGAFATIFAGSTYALEAVAQDRDTGNVFAYGTSYAKHTGEGGPVPATHKQAVIPFVYIFTVDDDTRIVHMEKIYDEASGREQLGWPTTVEAA